MILSHKYKFIFIKTKKTAGTSIEIALSKFCGPTDIITPITPADEIIRARLGYRGPQNYSSSQGPFYNHIAAREIAEKIDPAVWETYYKFCVERNPWDKVVSWYYWENRTEPRPSLSQFIRSGRAALVGGPGGFNLYTINDRIVVDKVLLYENLQQEMETLALRLNLPEVPRLPNAKAEFRVDKKPVTAFYGEQDRNTIATIFSREISLFGYAFPRKNGEATAAQPVDSRKGIFSLGKKGLDENALGHNRGYRGAPGQLDMIIHEADTLSQAGEIDKAIKLLADWLSKEPHSTEIIYVMTEILLRAKHCKESLEALSALPDTEQKTTRFLLLSGYSREGLGEYSEAERLLNIVLAKEPRNSVALNLAGILAYRENKKDLANGFFRKAMESDPDYCEPYTNLGVLVWASGDRPAGMELLERGMALCPTSPDAASSYHSAAVALSSFARAEQVFRKALTLFPLNKAIAFFLIDLLIQQSKWEQAMPIIEQAMVDHGIDDGILAAAIEVRGRTGPQDSVSTHDKKRSLSLCMIVKNEEKNLARCLMSVKPVVDEMIVIDTGSSDKTRDIATAFGAKLYDVPWTGDFSEVRNASIARASGDWILILDGDEVISPRDHPELMRLTDTTGRPVSYSFVTRNYIPQIHKTGWTANDGTYGEEAGTGWLGSSKVRLFPRDGRIQFINPVHELVEPSLELAGIGIRKCSIPIHHYGKLDQEKVNAKWEEYYILGKRKLEAAGENADALRELAIQAGELKRFGEAVDLWKRAIKLHPRMESAYLNLASVYLQQDEFNTALAVAEKALEINPGSKEVTCNYALCELYAGSIERAKTVLRGVLSKTPGYPAADIMLAIAHLVSGNKNEGIAVFNGLGISGPALVECVLPFAKKLLRAGRKGPAHILTEIAREVESATDVDPERIHLGTFSNT